MPLSLRALISFAAVAEAKSFTGAAKAMNLTQPWVSEQVRGLEEYLGFPLLIRRARSLDLTPEGAALLDHARRLIAIRDETEAWVRRLKASQSAQLRIGTIAGTAAIAERAELLDRFVARYDQVEIELFEDGVPALFDGLRAREFDLLITSDGGGLDLQAFEVVVLAEFEAHLLVPGEDPVVELAEVPVSALRGRRIVIAPPHVDPGLIESIQRRLSEQGASPILAPEYDRHTVERYARNKRHSVLRWRRTRMARKPSGDMVQLPLETPIRTRLLLVRSRGQPGRNVGRFWRVAAELGAGREALSGALR